MRIREDDGQALLLALVFLLFAGVVIGAILTFADAGLLAAQRLRTQRAEVYVADGAVDAAIHLARRDPAIGAYGSAPCMGTPAFTFSDTSPRTGERVEATVYCTFLQDIGKDRLVEFRACVDGEVRVVATVAYRDYAHQVGANPSPLGPVAEVRSWVASGATGQCVDGWQRT